MFGQPRHSKVEATGQMTGFRSCGTTWAEFAPFLDYSPEIRQVICSTNANESLHSRAQCLRDHLRRAPVAQQHMTPMSFTPLV
jgi:hypothetical protein